MQTSKKRYPGEVVEIPNEFKRHVAGKGGDNLQNISTLTGAQVLPRGNKLKLRGSETGVKQAELLLKLRVVCNRPLQLYITRKMFLLLYKLVKLRL